MKISVVLTARDAAETLEEAVASVLCQSYHDFEVMLVDNGSRDETREQMQVIARDDPRVSVLATDGTHVEAHQLGIEAARGELIARMDADDVCHADRFARQVEMLDADASLSGCVCGVRVKSRGREVGEGFLKYVEWLNGLLTPDDIARERPFNHST